MLYFSIKNDILRILYKNKVPRIYNLKRYISNESVAFGNIVKEVKPTRNPECVPVKYYASNIPQSNLHHLRWIMQKDILNQDIFLLGPPGPRKRHLAMQYLELTNREHEYVALSRDTTESDLKQRREISKGTAKYFDQSAVKAATNGRVLILDGIEKAERNVLPVLNNLLENREMHLEDGRLLIPASRYDKLLKVHGEKELNKWKLVRVDDNFRVIALGLPVPKYRGNPLDPPLRSRFQARDVTSITYQEWYEELRSLAPTPNSEKLEKILSCAFALLCKESLALGLPDFPLDNLPLGCLILEQNPHLTPYDIIYRLYPYRVFLKDGIENLEKLLVKLDVPPSTIEEKSNLFQHPPSTITPDFYVETNYQNELLHQILQSIRVADVCIVGTNGCGKTMIVNKVAETLGKEVENIVLYQDMTSRDLIQQRTTLENGDTIWKFSPLVDAALEGRIAVLDGIDRIHPSTLTVLHRLVHDREMQLYDGKRLIGKNRYEILKKNYNLTELDLTQKGVYAIHPDFKIVAIGEPPNLQAATGNWLSPEMLSLFIFHEMRTLSKEEETHVVASKYGPISKSLEKIIDLAHLLRNSSDSTLTNLSGHLSTRRILKIASRLTEYPTEDIYSIMDETFMIKFLPSLTRQVLDKTMEKIGIKQLPRKENEKIRCDIKGGFVTIGNTVAPVYKSDNLTKVPETLFYDVPQHLSLMEKLLQDFQLGYNLLLVGNQGVGKNKIVDRFLQVLNRPREYIQLHRDTTVQTLTVQPTIKNGILVYEDSPLVKAIKHGRVLVVDEADKAPTHVTCILKSLVESGRMNLSDGRRIAPRNHRDNTENAVVTHPDFRMIVLANRPGFPFLGNDFFGALGDLFSSHAVDNPSKVSETELLKRYGPDVYVDIIERLVGIFDDLRTMADRGLVNYPYSTREVVNIVKHLQKFPNTDLEDVLFNVFDFDRYNTETIETLGEVLVKHGFSSKNVLTAEYVASKRAKENIQMTINRYSGLDVSQPKHGKEDPKNEPHVGGNTWAGGTGGRDTAGLGGKGGPYRLDKGHKVHQLSDEEKNSVPEHVRKAAREMGKKAFQDKLKEIGMSPYDHSIYSQFSNAVEREVQSLRIILGNLQAKIKERQWYRHQTSGELDDVKLIDGIYFSINILNYIRFILGLLGEKTIFRRRTELDPELGTPQIKPKLFRVVVDVSGSMYRFNSYDGRLDRELEAVVLVMEAFEGFEDKIKYDIIGHSGEEFNITFVKQDNPPKDNKERLEVIRTMHAHSQFCWSGDHTLESSKWAVSTIDEEKYDEAIVIILSDANLQRYGISPSELAKAMSVKPSVSAYAVFIASLGDQAERLTQNLPAGRAFICQDTRELPHILKQIFSSSVVNN
ncbi:von Willebrand factor A domain-containing protein 8 isoform X2 [Diorhabda sublineata]|uniref:von Willebrand factor A domain-containing protein 8 isoform X2 n=1 Tax=Diorhabda sublineata TaxID=1163346 RepID=UPI0024E140D5|nr:von Willebrand factor A domain-containing protein 8 isoform X2 [Diorhabda sublineata]